MRNFKRNPHEKITVLHIAPSTFIQWMLCSGSHTKSDCGTDHDRSPSFYLDRCARRGNHA